MSFFQSPMYFGIQDHVVPGTTPFGLRIYHPTDDDVIVGAPLPKGPHPLVVFAHGERVGIPLCPPDLQDYKRWTVVLGALARSGFVVAVPALQDVLNSPATSAQRIAATVNWMRTTWSGHRTLHLPPVVSSTLGLATRSREDDSIPERAQHRPDAVVAEARIDISTASLGTPTALALVGHSWGARACAHVAANGGVQALAAIAGTWDDTASIDALRAARVPTLQMCGTADAQTFSYLNGLWNSLVTPKYQAAFQGAEHWDWFGRSGAIRHCDGTQPAWPDTGHIAGELLVGFLTRHVAKIAFHPPLFVRIPLLRPWLVPWFDNGSAIQVRWDAPGEHFHPLPATGDGVLGLWTDSVPWS